MIDFWKRLIVDVMYDEVTINLNTPPKTEEHIRSIFGNKEIIINHQQHPNSEVTSRPRK